MNRLPATLHRLSTFTIAVILLVIGASALLWKFDRQPAADWIERIDSGAVARYVEQPWWIPTLIGVAVIATVWGLALLGAAIRPHAIDDVRLDGSDQLGDLTIAPKLVADAIAEELEATTLFSSVSTRALDDRGHRLIRIEVTSSARHSYDEVVERLGDAVASVTTAFGDSDIGVQAFIHMDQVPVD